MDQSYEPERDLVVSATSRWDLTAFADVLAVAEQIGTNKGDRKVIDLYRTWIALHGAGGPCLHAAWFNLGAEWNHAGEPENAILAYRAALALRPDFTPAAINLGLLLEQHGEPQMALACWADALQRDTARVALFNQRARVKVAFDGCHHYAGDAQRRTPMYLRKSGNTGGIGVSDSRVDAVHKKSRRGFFG